jgi:hypothetical protein
MTHSTTERLSGVSELIMGETSVHFPKEAGIVF